MAYVHLTVDLMAAARLRQRAAQAGQAYHMVDSVQALAAFAPPEEANVLAVDLQIPGLDLARVAQWLQSRADARQGVAVYCYAQHVEESLLKLAREANLGAVMTRGQFFRMLDQPLGPRDDRGGTSV